MKLNFKTFGEGDPVIILHGLFGMLDNWQTFAKKLAPHGYQVYIVDQRNHGRSPHSEDFDYSLTASDLADFISDQGIEQAHIVGHSMGGKTAIQFAYDYPELTMSLTAIDIAPRAYQPGHLEIFDAILSMDLSIVSSRKDADEQLSEKISDPGIRMFLLKNLARSSDGFAWRANFPVLYAQYSSIIGPVEVAMANNIPTLFVRGTKSNYITEDDIKMIRNLYTQVTIADISAGHWIHAERPEELLTALLDFLK